VIEFNGIVVANNGTLVTTDALSFFNKSDGTFATLCIRTLLSSLPIQCSSDAQCLFFAAFAQFVNAGHGTTSSGGSP
jgi:hypothetical protein